jgi:hypothetical protein
MTRALLTVATIGVAAIIAAGCDIEPSPVSDSGPGPKCPSVVAASAQDACVKVRTAKCVEEARCGTQSVTSECEASFTSTLVNCSTLDATTELSAGAADALEKCLCALPKTTCEVLATDFDIAVPSCYRVLFGLPKAEVACGSFHKGYCLKAIACGMFKDQEACVKSLGNCPDEAVKADLSDTRFPRFDDCITGLRDVSCKWLDNLAVDVAVPECGLYQTEELTAQDACLRFRTSLCWRSDECLSFPKISDCETWFGLMYGDCAKANEKPALTGDETGFFVDCLTVMPTASCRGFEEKGIEIAVPECGKL